MKKVKTRQFGELEYKEEDTIYFEKGIPGFEQEKQFLIFQPDPENPLAFLQSIQTTDLSFVVANPYSFYPNYEFIIDEQTKEELEINEIGDIILWGIISVPEDFQKSTINLKAPLIINMKERKGKQMILHEPEYQTKTLLFPQLTKEGGK